jgi:hypothetical protein
MLKFFQINFNLTMGLSLLGCNSMVNRGGSVVSKIKLLKLNSLIYCVIWLLENSKLHM